MNGFKRGIAFVMVCGLASVDVGQSVPKPKVAVEPQWKQALGYGGAPECPKHLGSRTYRSDIARDSHTTAFITGESIRNASGCQATAEIQITQGDKTRDFKLPEASSQSFSIVDFSPDGSQLLLALEREWDGQYQHRDVSVALMSLASGETRWHNAWDIFGWKECDAMVEPQGFLPDGRVVIRARKSVWVGHPHPDCVNDVGLYAANPELTTTTRLPDSTEVQRYGRMLKPAFQACASDPDIVGSCFRVHGRIAAYNGTPTLRIWPIGTDRLLGVEDDVPVPEALSRRLDWEVNAYADFEVCPFAREREGEMQRVCVESAEHIVIRKR
jgi:hypothetical protein